MMSESISIMNELILNGCFCNSGGFPDDSMLKNLSANTCQWGDPGSIPGSGRSPGEGNENPLQHSCLGNRMDSRVPWAMVHGVAKESDMT